MSRPASSINPSPAVTTQSINFMAIMALLITVVTWASAFAGIRAALKSFSPGEIAFSRYLVASICLLLAGLYRGLRLPRLKDLPVLSFLGLTGFAIYNLALGYAQRTVPAGTASFIMVTAVIWLALASTVIFKESLGKRGWLGVLLALAGVGLIAFGRGVNLELDSAVLVLLAAAFCQAAYSLGQKWLAGRYTSLELTSYAVWLGTIMLCPFGWSFMVKAGPAPAEPIWAIIYMGVAPGALGYLTWTYALTRLPASLAGVFLYLVPGVAVLIAWVWLGELPAVTSLWGGGVIILGVVLAVRGQKH